MKKIAIFLILFCNFAHAQDMSSLASFVEGEFQFQSVKSIFWSQIVNGGQGTVERGEKVSVTAQLYMPKQMTGKVPAMVIMHGIGGLYTRDGRRRSYFSYAELLASNGIAAVIVDTHGARNVGVSAQLGSTEVSVYTFVADAFAAADLLRSHPQIDPDRIGIMGFSKGGMTSLLATDERFSVLSKTRSPFKLHIPIYPGCQNFPETLRPTKAPVHMLLGEKDNFTGITGCYEIEKKLKAANTPVNVIEYRGAYHGWDEDMVPFRSDDVSSEDCRWILKDGGDVWGGDQKPLNNAADGQAYFKSCVKKATIFIGRNDAANKSSRQAVIDIAKATFK